MSARHEIFQTYHSLSLPPDSMPTRFFYFDLGQVLVRFHVPKMLRQIAAVSGVDVTRGRTVLFAGGLQKGLELGQLTSEAFYEAFCRETRSQPPYEPLAEAARAFFETNHSILPVVAQMRQARYRTGVLSNTCDLHWQYCLRQYAIIAEMFDVYALSYEVGAMKPDPAIFTAAAGTGRLRRPRRSSSPTTSPRTSPAHGRPASTRCSMWARAGWSKSCADAGWR